ncbi:uncharacterized protein EV420DRAFT_1620557 [Desarmillaria tabescens]|uniref:CNH domain-containing protein n=1 Tax=Armillaria tabescens TaxID=1929756 RepID=A0AA39N5R3_ARMTA|nr:uncharacterized protein EV420DRAFT_1620557 [Desarmillaria tabescens]KAK0458912.1 hypothetical protein EV420DRAFT_1620557 [Desarmillaria tabescens]
MTSTPTNPVDVPPYQFQNLITGAFESGFATSEVRCAQALGSEIYVGFANGELVRFALQADDPNKFESYKVLSRQTLPNNKAVDEIVLLPCLSRALILSDNQIHFFTIPSLDAIAIKPIRHVVTFAVDHQHLSRPAASPSTPTHLLEPVEFTVIKRSSLLMYALRDKLLYIKEIPLPEGASLARRTGQSLCIAGKTQYQIVDLQNASMFGIIPICQVPDPSQLPIKPSITVIDTNEYLILSYTGMSTLGLFITSNGDPVRGTLEWSQHPKSVCYDYPYITSLLPNGTIEVHGIETQSIVQVIPAPVPSSNTEPIQRKKLIPSLQGYLVPSAEKSAKMRTVSVNLLRERIDV